MTTKKMHILKAVRYPDQDEYDTLELNEGVNAIVGELNAGKTKWLQMIDFALGDNGKPEEAFDYKLAEKYERVVLSVIIDGEEFSVERRWKEAGAKSKIYVNDSSMTSKQFSEFMLGNLEIPIIHVPSGNPYTNRTWPELSWREMFRHMYKQERFWSDFSQKQMEVVRSACILNFLNAATFIYPKEYGDFVSKKKERNELEAQKNVFTRVLQDVAIEIVGQPEMTVAVTPDSIAESRQRLSARLKDIDVAKAAILENYDRQATIDTPDFDTAKNGLESLHQELGKVESERNEASRRHSELKEYAKTLETELSRFERVKAGATVLADLKVTHCPACDQEIPDQRQSPNQCAVCGQFYLGINDDATIGNRRIEFEEQQVSEELNELRRLINDLDEGLKAFHIQISEIVQRIQVEKRSIDSARSLSVRAIPPELALFDQEEGNIMAQMQQLDRIERSLGVREEMNAKLSVLEEEIDMLDAEINHLAPAINYEGLSDLLSDRMNTYLNLVNTDKLSRWTTGRVSIKLSKDSFELFLDGQQWTIKAGGTANYIIQIAYHYALLSLSKDNEYHYPGFLMMDFPPHFSKAEELGGSENYLLKPFVDLCAKKEMAGTQVIIAGRAFANLEGANIIKL